MLREELITDLYLTTSPIEAGEPHTPFYDGPPLKLRQMVEKAGRGDEAGVRFEHLIVRWRRRRRERDRTQEKRSNGDARRIAYYSLGGHEVQLSHPAHICQP
jgi:hypothetical protein